jgi:hypothetical protein
MAPSADRLLDDDLRARVAEHEHWTPAEHKTWAWLGPSFLKANADPYLVGPDDDLANVRAVGAGGEFAQTRDGSLTPILDAAVRLARQLGIPLPQLVQDPREQ